MKWITQRNVWPARKRSPQSSSQRRGPPRLGEERDEMGFARDGRMLRQGPEIEPSQEAPRVAGGGAPHNNWIELTARGWHVSRLRVCRASSPPPLLLRRRGCGPCSQLIQALYGRCFRPQMYATVASAWTGHSPWSGYGIRGGGFSGASYNEFLRGRLGD